MNAEKPKNVIIKYPGGMPTYYGDCPSCGQQSKSMIVTSNTQRRVKYQVISFCPRCGAAMDWTEIIGNKELGGLQ